MKDSSNNIYSNINKEVKIQYKTEAMNSIEHSNVQYDTGNVSYDQYYSKSSLPSINGPVMN